MKKTISSKDLMVTARLSSNLPNFTENSNAACLVKKIVDKLDALSCENAFDYSAAPGNKPNFTNFDRLLDKCDINGNNTLFFFEERQQHT